LVLAKDEVTRCRTSVTVIPSSGPYEAGDVLTCVSNGYTEPIYKWTDSKGVVVSNGPNITLTNASFVLNCTATDSLTNSCSKSYVVRNSEGMFHDWHTTPYNQTDLSYVFYGEKSGWCYVACGAVV